MFRSFLLISVLMFLPHAYALQLVCSKSAANPTWETQVTVSGSKAQFPEGAVGVVYMRQREFPHMPGYQFTELRIRSEGMVWSLMCLNPAQKLALGK